MIIAAFAGVGKTTFANMYPDRAIDLCSMPFRWILQEGKLDEAENAKAAPYLLSNPLFPENYIIEILKAEEKYDYVLIPTISGLLKILNSEYSRPYILCYPDITLQDEYEQRYRKRGNCEEFMAIFIDQWEERIKKIINDDYGIPIPLYSGEYLSDIKEKIDAYILQFESSKIRSGERLSSLDILTESVKCKAADACIWIQNYDKGNYIYKFDSNDAKTRKCIYDVGKNLYEKDISVYTSFPYQFCKNWYKGMKELNKISCKAIEPQSLEEFMQVIVEKGWYNYEGRS